MMYKQATTPNEVNAFELSNLKKAASDAPLGKNNRKTLNGGVDSKQADVKRPLDKMIVQQARHEILDVRVKGGVDAATVSDFTECEENNGKFRRSAFFPLALATESV